MTAHTPSQATPTGASLSSDPTNATTGELITRLSSQVSELVRGEIALAKAELAQKGKRAGIGAGLAGAAGVLALYGVGALITTVIAALALVLPVWAAAFDRRRRDLHRRRRARSAGQEPDPASAPRRSRRSPSRASSATSPP